MENLEGTDQVQLKVRVPAALVARMDSLAQKAGSTRTSVAQLALLYGQRMLETTYTKAEAAAYPPKLVQPKLPIENEVTSKPKEEVDLMPYAGHEMTEDEIADENEALRKVEEEAALTPSEEEAFISPTQRHWHRINSRKPADAKRLWFDKGDEFGEFECECGKLVTRTVQR